MLPHGPGTYTIAVERFGYDVLTPPQTITVEPAFEEKLPPVVFRIKGQYRIYTWMPPITVGSGIKKEVTNPLREDNHE